MPPLPVVAVRAGQAERGLLERMLARQLQRQAVLAAVGLVALEQRAGHRQVVRAALAPSSKCRLPMARAAAAAARGKPEATMRSREMAETTGVVAAVPR
jgi:uncharacterized membrane protein